MARLRTTTVQATFTTFSPDFSGTTQVTAKFEGFDRDKGVLVGAAIDFTGSVEASVFFQDNSPFGLAAPISADIAIEGSFRAPSGQPALWSPDFGIFGSANGLLLPGGVATVNVSGSGAGFALFLQPSQFKDDKPVKVTADVTSDLNTFPLGKIEDGSTTITAELTYAYVKNKDVIKGNGGDNTLKGTGKTDVIRAGGGDDRAAGRNGEDFLIGGGGKDRLFGGGGSDSLEGGNGKDNLFGGGSEDILLGGGQNDRLKGGGAGDILFGGNGKDHLIGGGGNDLLIGDGGKDRLFGGSGRDQLDGGKGRDRLDGGKGFDVYTGGAGADTFVLKNSGQQVDIITDFGRGNDVIDISSYDVRRKDVSIEFNPNSDGTVLTINGEVEAILDNVRVSDVTNDMIIL